MPLKSCFHFLSLMLAPVLCAVLSNPALGAEPIPLEVQQALLEAKPEDLKAMNDFFNQQEPQFKFQKMSTREVLPQKINLVCGIGKLALLLHGRIGMCRSESGENFALVSAGLGISFFSGSLMFGYVSSHSGRVAGKYTAGGAGYASGLGVEGIYGKTELRDGETEERSLFLAGPAIGATADASFSILWLL